MPILCRKTFGHRIYDIIGCRYLLEADFPWNDAIPNKVIPNVNMLRGVVVNRIFRQSDSTLTVNVDNWNRVEVNLSKRVCQPTEPWSLFRRVGRSYVFCFGRWNGRALQKFELSRDCSIAEFEALSGCWFSTVHRTGKLRVGVTDDT